MRLERTNQVTVTDKYRAARDQLMALRGQQERAIQEFRWPDSGTGSTGPWTGSTPSPPTTTGRP